MCNCKDCQGITLLKGTDGRGIVSITAQEDGTFIYLYTDGTTYTSPDLTGPQGEPGVNAFKFTKQFTMTEGASVTISRDTLEACGIIPIGCLGSGTTTSLMDLHIQIWISNAETVTSTWNREDPSTSLIAGFSVSIDDVTGLITIERISGSIDQFVRIVILA